MATTTVKAQNFQGTPLQDVDMKDVPGVGDALRAKLEVPATASFRGDVHARALFAMYT
jgi:hypothetical protein